VALWAIGCAAPVHDVARYGPAGEDASERRLGFPLDEPARSLTDAHRPTFDTALGYAPLDAAGLRAIDDSPLGGLDAPARAALDAHGFVIRRDVRFRSFTVAMIAIYENDLPIYISADAVLDAVHRSFRDMLQRLEGWELSPRLGELVERLRSALAEVPLSETVRDALDWYLAVAAALHTGATVEPVAGADPARVAAWVQRVEAAEGSATLEVFGAPREVDLGRFAPRGHYARDESTQRYFRAMSWLSAIDMRLAEPDDGVERLSREQLDVALGLRALLRADPEALARWHEIEAVVGAFFGAPDAMNPASMEAWLATLPRDPDALDDAALVASLAAGDFGEQRIAGHFLWSDPEGTAPLPRAFAPFPLRYTVDSHVLSELVFDRVGGGRIGRMMPSPLDVSFAALGNDHAITLLGPELARHPYAPDLEAARSAVDGERAAPTSLYDGWLDALRELSTRASEDRSALPAVMRTEPWARRRTSAQLASWSQLRHDALLYAKPSNTAGFACEYPDAYVDPYPALWAAIARYAELGLDVIAQLPAPAIAAYAIDDARHHFEALRSVATTLGDIAERELDGRPLTEEQLAMINRAVRADGCAGLEDAEVEGWYADLLFRFYGGPPRHGDIEATISDVHVQPTDERGARVGRVLHAGVALPRAMIVTVDSCDGPRAYIGPVFSYHEELTEGFERLTDEAFLERALTDEPEDVHWMRPVITGAPGAEPR